MCPSTDSTPDPAPPGRACRPLHWALGAALLLAGACAATCAARFWAAPGAPASPVPASSPRLRELPRVQPDGPQGGFAQLVASDVLLQDGPLHWYSDAGLAGVSLAPGLRYDKGTQELVVAAAGVYYVFLRLELQRVLVGGASGSVSAALHLQQPPAGAAALAVTVALPPPSTAEDAHSAVGARGRLLRLGAGQRLSVHLRASAAASSAWQLAQGATTLGLFRVAAGDPSGPPAPRPTRSWA